MAKYYLTLLLLVFFTNSTVYSQSNLVDFEDLTFQSELEKKVFTEFFKEKKTDNFLLFMANGGLLPDAKVLEARATFYNHVNQYKQEKFAGKKNDKKIKTIYDKTHETFFKKYGERTSFEQIFYNGNFNSITGSALFGLVFDELQIPYTIKEDPSHVYLVVYPAQERIRVETTTPVLNIVTFTTEAKQQFIKNLKDQKIISSQEYTARSTDDLFDKYYYSDHQDVNLINLAGIQYMHDALQQNEQKKFEEAANLMDKSYLLFPTNRTAYLLMLTTSQAFESRIERDSVHATMLKKLSKFTDMGITHEMIAGEFARAINILLFEKAKKEESHRYYSILTKKMENYKLLSELKYIYNYETGRFAYNQGRYKEAITYFKEAMKENPTKMEASNAFLSALSSYLNKNRSNLDNIQSLEGYLQEVPTLADNNLFNSLLLNSYLLQCGMEYESEKIQQGDKYRNLFESFVNTHDDVDFNNELVGFTYSQCAIYYYRKGQTSKAKAIIESGLKYSPNNHELLTRQRMIK